MDGHERRRNDGRPRRVAVVGAGIAGAGAAWSLHRAGFEVEVFEANPEVGGNAKTHQWTVGGRRIVTGLSVLAWPRRYFKNYEQLLRSLDIETKDVQMRFFVRRGEDTYAHGRESSLGRRYVGDIARWARLVRYVAAINRAFQGPSGAESLYDFNSLNPMNYARLRDVCRLFGVSSGFWDDVLVPIYSSSFLTVRLDSIPAVIVPVLESMISVEHGGIMATWCESSVNVFARLLAGLEGRVHTERRIVGVRRDGAQVVLRDDTDTSRTFDEVVLACNATALAGAIETPSWLQRQLLSTVRYTDDKDETFLHGHVHGDPTVFPEAHREAILRDYCNYVDVLTDGHGKLRYENHFLLSPWVPAARGTDAVMAVYYNKPKGLKLQSFEKSVSNRRAHPDLSAGNLARARFMRHIQGKGHLHYCGSYTTPGNGHDLSLLSGFVVANAVGAPYPFADNPDAAADFARLRRFMLGR